MPQITLEYSANIIEKNQVLHALQKINHILAEVLPTDINTCKSRARECDQCIVGDGDSKHAFIHCTLNIMRGRDMAIKQTACQKVQELLKAVFAESLRDLRLQITIELNEETAAGIYSNLAIITHSNAEFVCDFVQMLPGMPKAQVKSRVIMTPNNAKRLLNALIDNIQKYEQHIGVIQDIDTQIPPVNFGTPTTQA